MVQIYLTVVSHMVYVNVEIENLMRKSGAIMFSITNVRDILAISLFPTPTQQTNQPTTTTMKILMKFVLHRYICPNDPTYTLFFWIGNFFNPQKFMTFAFYHYCENYFVCCSCSFSKKIYKLTFTTLWAFSADDKMMLFFLFFPRKQDLTFHANCLRRRQFAWNVKSCFLGKIRKIFQNVVCWKFYPEC